jgi:tetratricopeptide (TPR) repeat protein
MAMFHRNDRKPSSSRFQVRARENLTASHKSLRDLWFDALAAILLACSLTMATDFARRVLGSNPDELGIASISAQAVLSVAVTSTFTKAGWQWIELARSRSRAKRLSRAELRFLLALSLVCIIFAFWNWLPQGLAVWYNNRAATLSSQSPAQGAQSAQALKYLQRAIALEPGLPEAHYNLGVLLEDSYQYDLAATQYRQVIAASPQDVRSYNNLARLLLMAGKTEEALNVLNDAPVKDVQDVETRAAVLENRAWGELELGFTQQAIADSAASERDYPTAALFCLQGKAFAKAGEVTRAKAAWQNYKSTQNASNSFQSTAGAECHLLAEASHDSP